MTVREVTIGNKTIGRSRLRGAWSNWLCPKSMAIKVTTSDMIQCTDENANMVMIMAKSHFRDPVWSPFVLFHHEIL